MSDLLNQASLVMIPSGYKEDVVFSQIPTDGSGDLTFTRASNGTRVNSAGLVEVCPWNLVGYSEEFNNGYWNKTGGTSVIANDTIAPNGTLTADKITFSAYGHELFNNAQYGVTGVYTHSFYAKGTAGQVLNYYDGVGDTAITLTADWVRYTITRTYSNQTLIMNFNSYGSWTAGNLFLWGAQLNIGSTAKPYFPTTDRLNVPRLTYQNGGGGCPSLLLEKQSTNLALYSQDISNTSGSYWGDGSSGGTATVTANYATSPDGTQNATRIQLNEGSLYAVWQQVIATTSGTTYTYSIWLKAVSGTPTIVWIYDGTANRNITLTNEWVRYTWTFTGGTIQISRFGLWSGVWGTSSTADILAWGAQLEESSYATSYIPTTSSSATRVADACYKTGISSLIGQTEGVVFMDLQASSNAVNVAFRASDGTNNNRVQFEWSGPSSANFIVSSGGGIVVIITSIPITQGTRHKIAMAYKENDFVIYVDGSLAGSDTSGAVPTSLTQIEFAEGSAYPFMGIVNQAVLFKTRLTNAELASLTTI